MYTTSYPSSGSTALLLILPLVLLAFVVCIFIAWCRIFRKAGLPWERMFVPIYGSYWMYKLANSGWIYWVIFIGSFGFTLLINLLGSDAGLIVMIIYLLILLILHSVYSARMAKAFGKGGGFALGLIFLFPIFAMILGFGKARYKG